MGESSEASLRAAVAGRAVKERHEASATDAAPAFVAADWAALEAEWGWFGSVVAPAIAPGPAALVDDDLAYVAPGASTRRGWRCRCWWSTARRTA